MKRKIGDIMTRVVECVSPEASVRDVALKMKDRHIGAFPVCTDGSVVGMITDRDLALRVIAESRDPQGTRVSEVMTKDVVCCSEDDLVEEAVDTMEERQVRRLPVVAQDDRLVGLVTLGKLAKTDSEVSGEVLREMVKPSRDERS